jgi:hypothetical protein
MKSSNVRSRVSTKPRLQRFSFLLLIPFVIGGLITRDERAAKVGTIAVFEPLSEFEVESKRLEVHGPFHFPADTSTQLRKTALQKIDRGGAQDDDNDVRGPGRECRVPADCPAGNQPLGNPHRESPAAKPNWTWNIGAQDPQIAAGPDSLLVTAYQEIAFLNKADGSPLFVKHRPRVKGQSGITTGLPGQLGQRDRTTTLSTNDLFAPMLDDINAHLNLTEGQQKVCNDLKFDCSINRFYDTRVIFDEYRNRFWIVSLAMSDGINEDPRLQPARRGKLAVAVSVTSDPRDGWNLYWWDSIPNDGHWSVIESLLQHAADYPSLGISPKYVLEEHKAGIFSETSRTVTIVEADPLARGEKPTNQLKAFQFWKFKDTNGAIVTSSIQPAVHHGPAPALFAAVFASTAMDGDQPVLALYFFNDALGRFFRTEVPISKFFAPRDAPQPPTATVSQPFNYQMTNVGSEVIKAAFQDGRIFAAFNDCQSFPGSNGCVTSVRLVRIKIGTPNVVEFDQSLGDRFSNEPASVGHVFFGLPAVDVNKVGDAAIVYMRSGSHVFPQAAYSVLFHDADGIATGAVLHPGNDSHTGQEQLCEDLKKKCAKSGGQACKDRDKECASPERDLDTAGISVDPADDSIWIADGYVDGGQTRIAVGNILGRAQKSTKKN